ncbi:unnamed protein product, partial [Medioppia subpectinata]
MFFVYKTDLTISIIKMMRFTLICVILVTYSLSINALVNSVTEKPENKSKLLIILVDGFRWDYVSREKTLKGFPRIAQNGVSAKYVNPIFPANSYPNWYSITTGRYAETHGMIENYMYDSKTGDHFFMSPHPNASHTHWWTQSEPLWITAEKQGVRTAMFDWDGCQVSFNGTKVTTCDPYHSVSDDIQKADNETRNYGQKILDEFAADKYRLVFLYHEIVDHTGHGYGPNSAKISEAIRGIDEILNDLYDSLEKRKLDKEVNVVIVSDHGMTQINDFKIVELKEVDFKNIEIFLWEGAIAQATPKAGKLDEVYKQLSEVKGIKVYKKDDIPEKFHYKHNSLVLPLLVTVDVGYTLRPESVDSVTEKPENKSKLLIILVDGFRWDYVSRDKTLKGFPRIAQNGVSAKYVNPIFPANSYPNWYSITTGRYAENHGMIQNYMYDSKTNETFLMKPPVSSHTHWWTQSEPLWITAEKQGIKTAMYVWDGCQVSFNGTKVTNCVEYHAVNEDIRKADNETRNYNQKILDDFAADKYRLVFLYHEIVDHIGHNWGPNSSNITEAVKGIDEILYDLYDSLAKRKLDKEVNVVVVSDHGMTQLDNYKVIWLNDSVDFNNIELFLGAWGGAQITPKAGKLDEVYNQYLFCHILGINPIPNNGTDSKVRPMLESVDSVTEKPENKSKLLIILVDGFRWDYVSRDKTLKGFPRIAQNGVSAKYVNPIFPANSYPNWYSITTGRYAENHGMIQNYMYDSKTNETFLMKPPVSSHTHWWTQSEPLWITAEKQGIKTAMYVWDGCQVSFNGTKVTNCVEYHAVNEDIRKADNETRNYNQKILDDFAADKYRLVFLYHEIVDHIGHNWGPNSSNITEAVKGIDEILYDLYDSLAKRKLDKEVNVVVVSDHGMTQLDNYKAIWLNDSVDFNNIELFLGAWGGAQITPKAGKLDE